MHEIAIADSLRRVIEYLERTPAADRAPDLRVLLHDLRNAWMVCVMVVELEECKSGRRAVVDGK